MLLSILLIIAGAFASSNQQVTVHLTSNKTLVFQFEVQDGLMHLKSFHPQPEGLVINYLDLQMLKLKNNPNNELELKAIDFVYKQIPLNEKLTSYSLPGPLKWTEICDKIGEVQFGEFTDANNKSYRQSARVGEKASKCFGRCGFSCGVPFDNKNRYTQECLNHDLCNRELGENMGPCKDEYWAAADGYLNAKICEKRPK